MLEKGSSGLKSRSREKVGMTDVEAQISADEALARRIQVRQHGTGNCKQVAVLDVAPEEPLTSFSPTYCTVKATRAVGDLYRHVAMKLL